MQLNATAISRVLCGTSATSWWKIRDHAEIFLASAGELVGYISVDNLLTNRPITQAQINEIMPFGEQAAQALLKAKFRAYREAVIVQQRRVVDMTLAIASNEDQ